MDDDFELPLIRETNSASREGAVHLGPEKRHWLYGPNPPTDEPPRVEHPLLIPWEQWPKQLNHRVDHRVKALILSVYLLLWFAVDYAILYPHLIQGPMLEGESLLSLTCSGEAQFWRGKNQMCGLKGENCLRDGEEVIVKCPALCDRGWAYSALAVGDEMVKYRQFSIGGGRLQEQQENDHLTGAYRADSYPCASAVHGGALSPFFGGCVKMKFTGERLSFESRNGPYGTGWSVGFPSFFPESFVFVKLPTGLSGCHDPRLVVLCVNVLLGMPVVYLGSGFVTFWVSMMSAFWTIVASLDPPYIGNSEESTAKLLSTAFARLLPLGFVLYVLWITTSRTTLAGGSPLCKLFIWYPLMWAGAANKITFDRLPVDRLTPHDIKQMPGSILTVIVVSIIILACAIVQALQLWRAGKFVQYLKGYIAVFIALGLLAQLPNLGLRIHHYIFALIWLPGTGTRGITAYLLQGILLGLLLSGIARWDFASIVETDVSLLRGEAGASSDPPSGFDYNGTHVLWERPEQHPDDLTGFSLLVNDLEWWTGEETAVDIADLKEFETVFFRVGMSSMDSDRRGDYTRGATLRKGKWVPPAEGVS